MNILIVFILFFTSTVVYSEEYAEIPYDLILTLKKSCGIDNVIISTKTHQPNLLVTIKINGASIHPVTTDPDSNRINIPYLQEYFGKGALVSTNAPKGAVDVSFRATKLDLGNLSIQNGVVRIDQFREQLLEAFIKFQSFNEALKSKSPTSYDLQFESRNYKIYSALYKGKQFLSEAGKIKVNILLSDLESNNLSIVFDKPDITFFP